MRILIISDIHANLVALETVLKAAVQTDAIWCLGDIVGYGPAPNECCQVLRSLGALSLAGNHDWAVVGKMSIEDFSDNARTAVVWTRKQLLPENRLWLESLPAMQILPAEKITLVHASPRQPIWEYIDSPQIAAENMSYFDTPLAFFGHTHRPALYRLDVNKRIVTSLSLQTGIALELHPKLLLNPGSVGQPRDGDPRAAYAIFELESDIITPYRIEYDIHATQHAMQEAQLPSRLIQRLANGT